VRALAEQAVPYSGIGGHRLNWHCANSGRFDSTAPPHSRAPSFLCPRSEQQRLEKLSAAALSESRVSALFSRDALAASPGVTLGSLCPRLRELDLRATLISSWGLLGELGHQLPSLQVLNISENRLQPAAAEALLLPPPAGDAGSDAASASSVGTGAAAAAGAPSAAAASLVDAFPSLRVIVMNELRQPAQKQALPAAAAESGSDAGAAGSAGVVDVADADAEAPGAFWAAFVAPLHAMAPRLEEIHASRNRIRGVVAHPARPMLLLGAAADAAGGSAPALGVSAGFGAGPDAAFVPAGLFPRLRVLNLSDNEVAEWGQVHALSRLPALAVLQLSNNALESVWTDTSAPAAYTAAGATLDASAAPADASGTASASVDTPAYFPALEQLSLSGNALADLASLDALDGLRRLSSLRLTNNDIAAAAARSNTFIAGGRGAGAAAAGAAAAAPTAIGPSEARQVIGARLPKLLSLNNSEVRPREREDAEKAYTRRVGQAFAAFLGKEAITDVFPPQYVPQERVLRYIADAAAVASGAAPSAAAGGGGMGSSSPAAAAAASSVSGLPPSAAALPAAFQKTGDSGVIRAPRAVDVHSPFHTAPLPLCLPSLAATAAGAPLARGAGAEAPSAALRYHYYPELDPFELGMADREAAGRLQASCPRYFMLAGCYDLHAPSARDVGSASTIAASAVNVSLPCTLSRVSSTAGLHG
jgi:Leucine-rich repeat (LRR) protein